jgi:hypothetical protein
VTTAAVDEVTTTAATPSWSRRASRLAWLLVAAGVALRLVRFAANRSLWLDEAYLAESLLTFSFKQLATQPLLHWQAAPVGFLMLQKLAITLLGTSEFALRAVPLVAGVASMFLLRALLPHCLPPAGALVALAMFATVEPLVYYSAEAKQYAVDVAVCLAILLTAVGLFERPARAGRLVLLAAVGAAGILLSHPAVFALAGVALTLMGEFGRARRPRAAAALAIIGIGWAALFAANYALFLEPLTRHEGLRDYWAGAYMPRDEGVAAGIAWLGRSLYDVFAEYGAMWLPLPAAGALAAAAGFVRLWRRDPGVLDLLMMPVVLAVAAAVVHRFPFAGRVILFVVPIALVLIGAGAQAVYEFGTRGLRQRLVAFAAILVLIGPSVGLAGYFAARPPGREEMADVLAHLRERKQPGDVLYVGHISQVPFGYYRDRYGLGPDRFDLSRMEWVAGARVDPTERAYADELARLAGSGRVWVLLTHMGALGGPDEGQIVPAVLDRMGKRLDDVSARGARLLLYDLNSGPPATAPATGSPPPR